MTCEHVYRLMPGHAYLYQVCKPNDTVYLGIKCMICGHEKTATIGVEDKGVWE